MRIHTSLAGVLVIAASSLAPAQTKLQTKIFTSTAEGFAVTSTLIYGERDAILIDPQFLFSEAHKAAAMILESRKNLTTVYSTHAHPDHYFGLAVMKPAFPNARLVALPAVVTGIGNGWEGRYKNWTKTYGNNVPSTPVLPEGLQGRR